MTTTMYRPQDYEGDVSQLIKDAFEGIVSRRLQVNKKGSLISVRWMAKAIAKNTAITVDPKLLQYVESLFETDARMKSWGFGAKRAWDVKKKRKYASKAREIFFLQGIDE